ncbi:hypothetical protein [Pantoea trifolii]
MARQHNVNGNLFFKWMRLWKKGGSSIRPQGRK